MCSPFELLVVMTSFILTVSGNINPPPQGIICTLKVLADHTFYQNFANSDQSKVDDEIEYHVTKMDMAFAVTDFDTNGFPVGFNRTKQHTVQSEDEDDYLLAGTYDSSDAFLAQIATYPDVADYCMTLVFTYRSFPDNVCGSSYMAGSSANDKNGLCGKGNNVAFVTFADQNGRKVEPRDSSTLTMTHVMGVAFGASNDEEAAQDNPDCAPTEPDKKFVMSAQAAGCNVNPVGDNFKFSACSVASIEEMLKARPNCLVVFDFMAAKQKPRIVSDNDTS